MVRCPEGTEGKPWLALVVVIVCMILTYASVFHGIRRLISAPSGLRRAWLVLDLLLGAVFVALGVGGALQILLTCFPA